MGWNDGVEGLWGSVSGVSTGVVRGDWAMAIDGHVDREQNGTCCRH